MGIGRYALGALLGLVSLLPVALGARRLCARSLPKANGACARAAEAVTAIALLVVALQIVGILGELNEVGVTAGCAVTGAIAWAAAGAIPVQRREESVAVINDASEHRPSRFASTVAVVVVAVASAPWLGWVIFAYRQGMQTVDTLWYHLPFAARFVQTGSILNLHYVDHDPVVVFYPANSELLHALGLVWFRSDLLSPAINLGWAGLALTAAWAIGQSVGRAPHSLIAAVLVLATPGLVDSQPGGAYNDIVCIALLLSCAAMLVNGGVRGAASGIAALAAGLALGTKYTMILPAVALGAGVVAISLRGTRLRQAGLWTICLIGLGGLWYVRNAATAGSPISPVAIHVGPFSLTAPHVGMPRSSVLEYLSDVRVWRRFYLPGLRQSLGLAWWAILTLGAAGSAAALFARGQKVLQMLGAVTAASAVAFVLTPQFLGSPGAPSFFAANFRYAAPAIVLGLVLLPLHPVLRNSARATIWLGAATLILVATQIDPGVWPTGLGLTPLSLPIHGPPAIAGALLAAAIGILALPLSWRRRDRDRLPRRRSTAAMVVIVVLMTLTGGWLLARTYTHRRYLSALRLPAISAWAQNLRNARIGVVGLAEHYPLYGRDDSNYVQYVGASRPHAGFGTISTCSEWRRAVNRAHYEWLVLVPPGFPSGFSRTLGPELRWTISSPAAQAILRDRLESSVAGKRAVLVRVRGLLDPATCPRA